MQNVIISVFVLVSRCLLSHAFADGVLCIVTVYHKTLFLLSFVAVFNRWKNLTKFVILKDSENEWKFMVSYPYFITLS